MKNTVFAVLVAILITSCNVFYQTGNTADDVYYSPKSAKTQVQKIPDVNTDEIIRKNPPQYGNPQNSIDDANINERAAAGYPGYKAYQDSLYNTDPSLYGYDNTSQQPFDERDSLRQARKYQRRFTSQNNYYGNSYGGYPGNYGNMMGCGGMGYGGMGFGMGYNSWNGFYPSMSFGWSNYPYSGFYGGYGLGYNPFYSPFSFGFGYGGYSPFYNPYYGGYYGGYYNGYNSYYNPYYNGYYNDYSHSGSSTPKVNKPRDVMGGGGSGRDGGERPTGDRSGSLIAPVVTDGGSRPIAQPDQSLVRPGSGVNNASPAKLERIDGRPVYTAPQQPNQASDNRNIIERPIYTPTRPSVQGDNKNAGSAPANYTQPATPSAPTPGAARLDNDNGRPVYVPPARVRESERVSQPERVREERPSREANNRPAYSQPERSNSINQGNQSAPQMRSYSSPSQMSAPSAPRGGGGGNMGGGGGRPPR